MPDFARARRQALVERVGTIGAQRAYSARCPEDLVPSLPGKEGDAQLVDSLELFVCHRWIEDGDADSAWRRVGRICDAERFGRLVRQVALTEALVLSWPSAGVALGHRERQDQFLTGVASALREEFSAPEMGVFAAIVRAMLGVRMDRRRLRGATAGTATVRVHSNAAMPADADPYDPADVL